MPAGQAWKHVRREEALRGTKAEARSKVTHLLQGWQLLLFPTAIVRVRAGLALRSHFNPAVLSSVRTIQSPEISLKVFRSSSGERVELSSVFEIT